MSESAHNTNSTSSSSKDASPISINLDALSSIDDMPPESLIFSHLHTILVDKIRAVAAKNLEEKSKQDIGSRACFFIDGTRGSGKSTLMRAVRKTLTTETKNPPQKFSIASLADIDPTELAQGEDFLLYLLGKILNKVEQVYKKHCYETDAYAGNYQAAMECIRRMSGGLRMILNAEDSLLRSDDPEYFIEESVEKCASSSELRTNLNNLLDKVCDIVGADVFLVTVDDADMNFGKCVSVLEYVRKYMHSPRLIFLFAGDMQLYAHVVRGMHMGNFEKKLFSFDNSQQAQRLDMLDRLEDQYLLKFFPIDNRVSLGSFYELILREKDITLLYTDTHEKQQEVVLSDILHHKLRLMTEELYIPIMKRFIGTFPLRSALSLLKLWITSDESDIAPTRTLADGIQRVALQNLIKHNINYTGLPNGNLPVLLNAIIHHMATPELNCSHQDLLPSSGNSDLFFPSFYLSAEVAHHAQTHAAKLIYLCTLFPNWYTIEAAYHHEQEAQQKAFALHQQMQDSLSHLQTSEPSEWGAHLTNCMALYNENSPGTTYGFGFGIIRLLKKAQELDKEHGSMRRHSAFGLLKSLAELSDPAAEQNADTTPSHELALALIHSLSGMRIGKATRYYLSIFNLILLAAELLELHSQHQDLKTEVTKRLTSGYLPVAVGQPNATDDEDQNTFGFKDSFTTARNTFGQFSADFIAEMATSICQWINKYSSVSYISTAKALQLCWNDFCARCETSTANYLPEYYSPNLPPTAGTLLVHYMKAFEDAARAYLSTPENEPQGEEDLSLAACLAEFPLWKVLKESEGNELFKTLNATHIVPLKNKTYIRDYFLKRRDIRLSQSAVAKLEQALHDKKEELDKENQLLHIATANLKQIESEEERAQKANEESEETLVAAQRRLDSLEKEKEHIHEQVKQLEQEHNQANTQQNIALQVNMQYLNANRAQLAELEDLELRINRKKTELSTAKQEGEQEKDERKRTQMEFICFSLSREVNDLEARLENVRQVQAGTQKELTESQHNYETLKNRCAQLMDHLNRAREQNAQISAKRERAYTVLDMQRINHEQTQNVLRQIQERIQTQQTKCDSIQARVMHFEEQYQDIQADLDTANMKKDEAFAAYRQFMTDETE